MTTNGYFTPAELKGFKTAMINQRADLRRKGGYTAGTLSEEDQNKIDRLTRTIAKLGA